MKIVTWNVNGIRARATAFERWIMTHRPDVVCLQEIKAHPDQVPEGLREIRGYSSRWHGARGGYSGVSIHVSESLGPAEFSVPHFDEETRVLQVRTGGLTIVNVYTPLGQKSYTQKIGFLGSLVKYIDALTYEGESVILCGDLNVAHRDADVHPEMYVEDMLCTRPDERAMIDSLHALGLEDLFRYHHPDEAHAYSWWPYYGGARARNVGWRIDYILAPSAIAVRSRGCWIQREESSSDHSPVLAEIGPRGAAGNAPRKSIRKPR
jgi:exodeoxyribonuclease-3